MNKFTDISLAVFIVFVIVLLAIFYLLTDEENILEKADLNSDGYVTADELKQYINSIERLKKDKKLTKIEVFKCVISGFIRGFLMGLIIQDLEGGLALGFTLATVNPIMMGIERHAM